jgi:hypothetical protein
MGKMKKWGKVKKTTEKKTWRRTLSGPPKKLTSKRKSLKSILLQK